MAKEKKLAQVPREAVATPDDVRKFLELTDEQIDELKIEQEKKLKLFRSRARLTLTR